MPPPALKAAAEDVRNRHDTCGNPVAKIKPNNPIRIKRPIPPLRKLPRLQSGQFVSPSFKRPLFANHRSVEVEK